MGFSSNSKYSSSFNAWINSKKKWLFVLWRKLVHDNIFAALITVFKINNFWARFLNISSIRTKNNRKKCFYVLYDALISWLVNNFARETLSQNYTNVLFVYYESSGKSFCNQPCTFITFIIDLQQFKLNVKINNFLKFWIKFFSRWHISGKFLPTNRYLPDPILCFFRGKSSDTNSKLICLLELRTSPYDFVVEKKDRKWRHLSNVVL